MNLSLCVVFKWRFVVVNGNIYIVNYAVWATDWLTDWARVQLFFYFNFCSVTVVVVSKNSSHLLYLVWLLHWVYMLFWATEFKILSIFFKFCLCFSCVVKSSTTRVTDWLTDWLIDWLNVTFEQLSWWLNIRFDEQKWRKRRYNFTVHAVIVKVFVIAFVQVNLTLLTYYRICLFKSTNLCLKKTIWWIFAHYFVVVVVWLCYNFSELKY